MWTVPDVNGLQFLAAFAGTVTVLVGGSLAILRTLVKRHLDALTRLESRSEDNTKALLSMSLAMGAEREALSRIEERAAQNTTVLQAMAFAFDSVREQIARIHADTARISRHTIRLLDHAQLTEHESPPPPPPEEIPRGAAITGSFRAVVEPPPKKPSQP